MWNSFLRFALLAPSLVLGRTLAPPLNSGAQEEWAPVEGRIASFDPSYAIISIKTPHELAVAGDRLNFHLHVSESHDSCGFGTITVDDRSLPQKELDGSVFAGSGPLLITPNHLVRALWNFTCVHAEGREDSQLLTFIVASVDGRPVENIGFSLNFTQKGELKFIDPLAESSTADSVDTEASTEPTLEDDLAQLDFMRIQLEQLKYMIQEKTLAIAERKRRQRYNPVTKCDNLGCVAQTIGVNAQRTAHELIRKLKRSYVREGTGFRWRPRPPIDHGTPANHTCNERERSSHNFRWRPRPPPAHEVPGNHTCGEPKHGARSRPPPPHFKKPHLSLPFCRHPPPPRHLRPQPEHRPHRGPYAAQPDNHPTDSDRHWVPNVGPGQDRLYDHERPSRGHGMGRGGFRFPNGGFAERPRHRPAHRMFFVFTLGLTVFLLTLFLQSLRRRCTAPSKQAARHERREERRSRRSLRHAAHKEAINNFLARVGCRISHAQVEEEAEKDSAADGLGPASVTNDLTELMNAADMVADIIAAEEGRSRTRASIPFPPRQRGRRGLVAYDMDIEEEQLPAYEDRDSSDMGSVVNGCRHTPGSSDYTPSLAGSASEYLGPDMKD